jgi:hypothetical protein
MTQAKQAGRAAELRGLLFALLLGWSAALAAADAPPRGLPAEALDALESYLEEEASPLAGQATVQLEAADEDTALVSLLPREPEAADPAVAFLRLGDGRWTVLGVGSDFDADFYQAHDVPDSLRVYGPLGFLLQGPLPQGQALQGQALQVYPRSPADAAPRYRPVEGEVCAAWTGILEEELSVPVESGEATFSDYLSGTGGQACLLTATGTGEDFAPFPQVAADLMGRLEQDGWLEDPRYAADGPMGTAAGLRQEDGLAILRVGWEPAEEASCPGDQPIFECEIAPEDQRYTVSLELAREVDADEDDGMAINGDAPVAAQRATEALAERLGVAPETITLVEAEYVEWPDSCLGLASPGQMCAQVITPGYRITLEADGELYVYHSDESGRALLPADTIRLQGGP